MLYAPEGEARAISALNHPNIRQGETPAAHRKTRPFGMERTLGDGAQIAGALSAAYARGIVHRGLNPANIRRRSPPCWTSRARRRDWKMAQAWLLRELPA